jgi:hypothetical protein
MKTKKLRAFVAGILGIGYLIAISLAFLFFWLDYLDQDDLKEILLGGVAPLFSAYVATIVKYFKNVVKQDGRYKTRRSKAVFTLCITIAYITCCPTLLVFRINSVIENSDLLAILGPVQGGFAVYMVGIVQSLFGDPAAVNGVEEPSQGAGHGDK